jgi:ubiquinone/menaquinone biosynthesis C-methylase UbiE
MEGNNSIRNEIDEDQLMKSQMEKMVSSYDSYMKKMTLGREHTLRQMTVRLARLQQGESVLEVGCGTGSLTIEAKRAVGPAGRVCGIDVIPGMIEASQRKAAAASEDITFQVGSMADIPFPGDSFDAVLCSFMIFHMSQETRRKGIGEAFRVLKPRGRLLVLDLTLPAQTLQRAVARTLFGDMLSHDLRELLPPLEDSGFSEVEIAPASFRVMGLSALAFLRASAGGK